MSRCVNQLFSISGAETKDLLGCFFSNDFLAKIFKTSMKTAIRVLATLAERQVAEIKIKQFSILILVFVFGIFFIKIVLCQSFYLLNFLSY